VKKILKRSLIVTFLLILSFGNIFGQKAEKVELNYISPVPGSKYIMPGINIAFRHGEPFDAESTKNVCIEVKNSRGAEYKGKLILSDDDRTLIFLPQQPFGLGEEILIDLKEGLVTQSGKEILPVTFNFYITNQIIPIDNKYIEKIIRQKTPEAQLPYNRTVKSSIKQKDNNLPEGFAPVEVLENNNPPDGYYFYTPYDEWGYYPDTEPFLTIVDKYGTPVYYKKLESYGFDLKLNSNGYLSFYSYQPLWKHQLMDSSFNIIDTYQMGNGYVYTDFHDFQILENGHAFVMTYDPQLIDMSQVVPGGNPAAIVSGFVMQELDSNDNVIFQWRSWDHFEITDVGSEIDLTAEEIDYVHGNTIEVESDTSLLFSSRNMHEITKVHRNTGEIIWRFGGSNNQFELFGDTIWFNRQHDSRRIYNGHVTAYDNGTKREPFFSSAVEYDLNTDEMTATMINRYRRVPDYFGIVMGNSQWTSDETIVVGWGSQVPGITEFDKGGNVLYELFFEGRSYRAYRFPWKTNYFTTEKDTLNFGYIWQNDSLTLSFEIYNQQDDTIKITSYYTMFDKFSVTNEFPINLPPDSSKVVHVKFSPGIEGNYEDVLTLNSDINEDSLVQRIAQQVYLCGNATQNQGLNENNSINILVSPNPVKNLMKLSLPDVPEQLEISLYSFTGKKVLEKNVVNRSECMVDISNFPKGNYLLKVENVKTGETGVVKILKQ